MPDSHLESDTYSELSARASNYSAVVSGGSCPSLSALQPRFSLDEQRPPWNPDGRSTGWT